MSDRHYDSIRPVDSPGAAIEMWLAAFYSHSEGVRMVAGKREKHT